MALAAPWTRPCSWLPAARLTRLEMVGMPKPIPSDSGTRISTNIGTECVTAAPASPIALKTRPAMNVVLSPSRRTIGRMNPPWTIAPSSPKPANRYPVGAGTVAKPRRDEQPERRLKDREREPEHEVDGEHAPEDRTLEQLRQIAERVARARVNPVNRFRQPQPRHDRGDDRDPGRRPDRRGVADPRQQAAQRRAEDEAEPEGRAENAVGPRAILRLGDIGDVRARRRDVAARQPVDDARDEQHRNRVRHGQHDEAGDRPGRLKISTGRRP